jgi:hypothetical protein
MRFARKSGRSKGSVDIFHTLRTEQMAPGVGTACHSHDWPGDNLDQMLFTDACPAGMANAQGRMGRILSLQ